MSDGEKCLWSLTAEFKMLIVNYTDKNGNLPFSHNKAAIIFSTQLVH